MKISKEAARDAAEFARAQMYYGEGAGTRRKLINTSVDYKSARIPGYQEAFYAALNSQDMSKHAEKAHKERRRKDLTKKVDRNVRGFTTGDRRSVTTDVMVVASAGYLIYLAHQEGYDRKALEFLKPRYEKAKAWVKNKKRDLGF